MSAERACCDALARAEGDRYLALQETVALGLLVARKWDRATSGTDGRTPPLADEVARYDSFTDREIQEFRATASRAITEYAASLPQQSWWTPVIQGCVSALFYSLFVALIVLIVKLSGSDVITVLRMIVG